MQANQYVRILVVLGMIAVTCGTASAVTSIGAENEHPSSGSYPVCTSPCECISENEAAARWGTEGYEKCSKSVCGQSANAMVQYYCLHQIGGMVSSSMTTCQAPCECHTESSALARWGVNGYTQCSKSVCAQDQTSGGVVPHYCYRQFGSTLLIGGAKTAAPTAAPTAAAGTQVTQQAPAQTQAQTQVQTQAEVQAPAPANPSPAFTWPAANAIPQRTPVGTATILAAIGAAMLVAAGMRRK